MDSILTGVSSDSNCDSDEHLPNGSESVNGSYEPLLAPSTKRLVVYPIEYPDLWLLYKKAQGKIWEVAVSSHFIKKM